MLIGIFKVLFGLFVGIIYVLSEITGLSYEEVSVYLNLYIQGALLVISIVPIFYCSIMGLLKMHDIKCLVCYTLSVMYSCLYIGGYVAIFKHYTLNVDYAFKTCVEELFRLGRIWPGTANEWTNYYIVNIFIFVIGFLALLFINRIIFKMLRKSLQCQC